MIPIEHEDSSEQWSRGYKAGLTDKKNLRIILFALGLIIGWIVGML